MLIHTVYFWMAETATVADRDRVLADCRELLAQAPTVRSLHAGVPAGTPIEFVDNSYSVALIVTFDDAAGAASYAAHPVHFQFIDRHLPKLSRVVIYDTLV